MRIARFLFASFVAISVLLVSSGFPAFADGTMRCRLDSCNGLPNATIYVDWWGPEWSGGGFSADGVSSTVYQSYIMSFLNTLHQDPTYLGILSQYLGANFTINVGGQWNDTSSNPGNRYGDGDVQNEVVVAAQHFGDVDPNQSESNIIMVATPTGRSKDDFSANGGNMCSYHGEHGYNYGFTILNDRFDPYIYFPFMPDAASSCWDTGLNSTDSFGHGILDGTSSVLSHEIAETLTDYNLWKGWRSDHNAFCIGPVCAGGDEIGDVCNGQQGNFGLGNPALFPNNYYSVQLLWSNTTDGCSLAPEGNPSISSPSTFTAPVGSISPGQEVTVTNTGDGDLPAPVFLGPWNLDDPTHSFTLSGNTCPTTLHPGESCSVQVQFAAHATATATATLTFPCVPPGFPIVGCPPSAQITLSGHGPLQTFHLPPLTPHIFPHRCIFCTRTTGTIHFVNTSAKELTVQGVWISGQFAKSFSIVKGSCGRPQQPIKLAPKANCSELVSFKPSEIGPVETDISFATSIGRVDSILSGKGTGPVAALSGKLFANNGVAFPQSEGLKSQSTKVTLKSVGQNPLTLTRVGVSGPYGVKNTCPKVLSRGKPCTLTLVTRPKKYGPQLGTLTIHDNAPNSPQRFALSGVADVSSLGIYPQAIDFGVVNSGDQPTQDVTVGDVESGTHINSISLTGPFSEKTTCPNSGWVFGGCVVTVQVNAKTTGIAEGELVINADGAVKSVKVPIQADVEKRSDSQTGLKVSPNPASPKDDVVATASVSPSTGNGQTPTGTVTFDLGGITTTDKLVSGEAVDNLGRMAPGGYKITAWYNGDTTYKSSMSNEVDLVVNPNQRPA